MLAFAALDAQGDARQDATRQTQLPPVAPVSLISISGHATSFTAQFPGERTYEAAAQGCPAPAGVRFVSASVPESGQSVALGTLVNGAPWAIAIYPNQDPDVLGAALFTIPFPGADIRLAFQPGQHRLVARPTGAASGDLPKVTWSRQIEIDPRVRGFKLEFNPADFE